MALVNRAAVNPGHALEYAFGRKMTASSDACRRADIAFIPLAVETLSGWHGEAELQIKKLGAALARHSGREEAECTRHLFQRLSILLVKGNASLFLNRQPHHPDPEIDGIE